MRWTNYILMFFVCMLGSLSGMMIYDRWVPKRDVYTLQDVINAPLQKTAKVKGQIAFEEAAAKLIPAVLAVYKHESSFFDPNRELRTVGAGSGVIVSSDGYIVTNYHVVEGAEAVTVRMLNGKVLPAKIVGKDELTDLALLKVDATNLPFAKLANSDDVAVGEWVIAVGNPLGYEGTVSVGVVSALNRDLPASRERFPLVGAIQTDAAINAGNSGGALGNIQGEVIGINTIIASTDMGSIGIGFAIPSNRVRRFISDIEKYGKARHPDLGVRKFLPSWVLHDPRFSEDVGPNPPDEGLVIWELSENSPLRKAGLGQMDVLLEVENKKLATLSDYLTFLLKAEIGQKVKIKYWQRGEIKTATVTLQEMEF
ncbi:MAG TPA: trypsin-like peptidase domain-containing protein [Fimbriimonadales bacterium]|nr:trypsin-like peptidase domain-containing protein [Fimbriimonadales bacterium]